MYRVIANYSTASLWLISVKDTVNTLVKGGDLSGYRSKAHNQKVGGVPQSSHRLGKACDIACIGSRHRFLIVNALIEAGFNRIGIAKNFIHVDNDMNKSSNVIWTY